MGLYDRDYGRNERTAWDRIENPRSITITLIIINVAVWLLDILFSKPGEGVRESFLAPWFSTSGDTLIRPWLYFQFLTYGFLHDVGGIFHVLFNMVGLFFFGRIIEQRIGRMEFLRFFLVSIVAGGIIGSATNLFLHGMGYPGYIVGASGGVVATVVLFACYYPNQEIYLMAVFPVKAWIVASLYVATDLAGALGMVSGAGTGNTAFTVHLAGAFFSLGYYYQKWNLGWMAIGGLTDLPSTFRDRSRRMKIKLHDPDKKLQREADDADRILAKIHQSGEASLTAAERKTLERYSRRQREKRGG